MERAKNYFCEEKRRLTTLKEELFEEDPRLSHTL
jgi:hypothetical protein